MLRFLLVKRADIGMNKIGYIDGDSIPTRNEFDQESAKKVSNQSMILRVVSQSDLLMVVFTLSIYLF